MSPGPVPGETPINLADMRNALLDRLGITAAAWSADGRHFAFVTRLEDAPAEASYVRIVQTDGTTLLGQVHRRVVTHTALAHLDVAPGPRTTAASVPVAVRHAEGDGIVLGRLEPRRLVSVTDPHGFADATVQSATRADVAAHRAQQRGDSAPMPIGFIASQLAVRAELSARGFNRHTLLCGQSGSGKTFSTGAILEQLLHATDLRIVVLDPNSDYVRIRRTRSFEDANRARRDPLTRNQFARVRSRHERVAQRVKVARADGGDLALQVRFSHLTLDEQALCLRLDPIADLAQYNVLRTIAATLGDDYGIDDVQDVARHTGTEPADRLAMRIENLGVAQWSLWAARAEDSIDRFPPELRAVVLDTGSLSDERERAVVALSLFGRLRRRPTREPVLVVLDEAHHVCPPHSDDPLLTAVTERVVWAAGEGRKYGQYMMLATQRPQKLHPNVVSQCENLILMRINSEADRAHLASLFSHVPSALIEASREFGLGEALVAGRISPVPMRAVIGGRITPEGGADLPTDWASSRR